MGAPAEDEVRLPGEVGDVTAAWATEALAARHPGVEVTALEHADVLHGSTTKIRLRLAYNDAGEAAGLPPTMILKACMEAHDFLVAPGAATEVHFYRDLAPRLPVEVPACYFAATAPDGTQSVLLLEDLAARGATFGRATDPLRPDAAAAAVELLARLHARWWEHPDLPGAQFTDAHLAADSLAQTLLVPEHWARSLAGPQAAAVPGELRDRERVVAMVRTLWELDARLPQCLNHGDAHLGNMYFAADRSPGYLDWQNIRRGPWEQDYTYFLVGALDVEDRRTHERDLLRLYLDRLRAGGAPAPGFDDAWASYRRHLIHGFLWVVCPVEMQPVDVIEANAIRFATAVTDLDCAAALTA